uniref:hypothetical protein n=1 Tax=Paenibacillus pini TaxID=669461 RepID=UPI00056ACFFF
STALPVGEVLQVRVKVKDEHAWSEWSESGWLEVYPFFLKNTDTIEKISIEAGKQILVKASVSNSVYGDDNTKTDLLNGIVKVKISGYKTSPFGKSGQFGGQELLDSGSTIIDVPLYNGIAEIPLILTVAGSQTIYYEVIDMKESLRELNVQVLPSEIQKLLFLQEPKVFKTKEQLFIPHPIILVTDMFGNPIYDASVEAFINSGEGELTGTVSLTSNKEGIIEFTNLKLLNSSFTDVSIIFKTKVNQVILISPNIKLEGDEEQVNLE